MGGYEWICADLYEDNAVMQSTGVTSGMWPGYVYNHNKYYRRSFEDRNISGYDDKTRDLYSKICEAEYDGNEYGEGLYLIPENCFWSSQYYYNFEKAFSLAIQRFKDFGADYPAAWLGNRGYGHENAHYVRLHKKSLWCNEETNQQHRNVIAPAFNLDLSKITVQDSNIAIITDTE